MCVCMWMSLCLRVGVHVGSVFLLCVCLFRDLLCFLCVFVIPVYVCLCVCVCVCLHLFTCVCLRVYSVCSLCLCVYASWSVSVL